MTISRSTCSLHGRATSWINTGVNDSAPAIRTNVESLGFKFSDIKFNMHEKYKPGDRYDPNRFVGSGGFQLKIQFYEKLFNAVLQREREAKAKQ